MNKNKKKVWLGLSLCLGLLALAPSAQAGAIARSINQVSDFGLSFSLPVGFSGYAFSIDVASLNGVSGSNVASLGADSVCISCAFNNSFTTHVSSTAFSYADVQIANANVLGKSGTAASVGEVYLTGLGAGAASGSNRLSAFISLPVASSAVFGFMADPLLQASLSSGGDVASSSLSLTITIADLSGRTVFNWVPNGVIGSDGIIGGMERADASNLNRGLSQLGGVGGGLYDPSAGYFSATSNELAAGFYMLNIAMSNSVFASSSAAPVDVPEPGTIWLAGLGMLSMLVMRRRFID